MPTLIPEEHAQILWNNDEDGNITDVCVIDFRETDLQDEIADRYANSRGADGSYWLTDTHPTENPAGLFGYLAFRCGFTSVAVARQCVREFSHLECATWARQMLAAAFKD